MLTKFNNDGVGDMTIATYWGLILPKNTETLTQIPRFKPKFTQLYKEGTIITLHLEIGKLTLERLNDLMQLIQ